MNYRHLIAFFIALAFALPATAAGWPEGSKTEFANECSAGVITAGAVTAILG
ncbi:hypothetical protein PH586_23300 [Pseudomonas sp. SA3-5]|uniref:Uncharacterized protein n=1 Tax=Pseudomonas aestuarii TaxID=3018340 RepID=A0ABT4XM78_9PSED|nr:hypothetical protein [Pseudomonas aestuarii]MDA7089307.1 hypothetical protein [Pseudomonas aestuarii]